MGDNFHKTLFSQLDTVQKGVERYFRFEMNRNQAIILVTNIKKANNQLQKIRKINSDPDMKSCCQ